MGGAGTGRVVFDAGAGNTKMFREAYLYTNATGQLTEVQLREYGADVQGVKFAHVWNVIGGVRYRAFPPIPVGSFPAPATALDVTSLIDITTGEWADSSSAFIRLAVSIELANGNQSTGAEYTVGFVSAAVNQEPPEFVPQYRQNVSPVAGLNSDLLMPGGCGLIHVVDPAAPFSFGGFLQFTMRPGMILPVSYLGTQLLTIVNEDASSTAAARIRTPTGINMVLVGPCEMLFIYDDSPARWQLVACQDGRTGRTAAGPVETYNTNGSCLYTAQNPNATGVNATAGFYATANAASVVMLAYGSGATTSRWGHALGGWDELIAYGGNGLSIGTFTNKPVEIGSNGIKVLEIDATQKLKIGGGAGISKHLSFTTTWDPANIAANSFDPIVVTVTGASLGDVVCCSFSLALTQGLFLFGQVTAANTVTVIMGNMGGAAVNPGSGTLRVDVWKH